MDHRYREAAGGRCGDVQNGEEGFPHDVHAVDHERLKHDGHEAEIEGLRGGPQKDPIEPEVRASVRVCVAEPCRR